ncbi:unnamed protein product, partial [Discosporangium mesarthrocarpum]
QITVNNIHLRYEDQLSLSGEGGGAATQPLPLSIGLTLGELLVQTADEKWNPTYVAGENREDGVQR